MVEKTINVFISPNYFGAPPKVDNGGIRRVVEAENKYLEEFGVKSVPHIEDADVIQNQGGMQSWRKGIPIINTNHGMMWSRYPWGEGMQEVNKSLVDAMSMAVAHTAPSEWVARSIRRGGLFYPEVIYHGVDANEFIPSPNHGNAVLWNKARSDFVSDPSDLAKVAKLLPRIQFNTTIGTKTDNVNVLGITSYADMKSIIANAGVYLATARETFGIGTLEAMACGIPIAGWAWGGTFEIVHHGETGYLAPPGRFDILAECIMKCLEERERLSANCIDDVIARWKWQPRIKQYADLIKSVYNDFTVIKRPAVSIIVTAYNLDKYLNKCLNSVQSQTLKDFECLVIDDAQLESTRKIVQEYDDRFKYIPTPENLGLPGARNFGFSKSRGRYIRHLDADDWLADNAIELESTALDNDPFIHIAYGHLCVAGEDGTIPLVQGSPERSGWPPPQFSWIEQMAHLNQIPSCVMMRREVMKRSGGYRVRNKRQEDAEFWCRVTSLGFRAKKVTEAITYFHRMRKDSKGQLEWDAEGKEPDWTAWFPWSIGADDYRKGVTLLKKNAGLHPDAKIVPFGAQGTSPEGKFWYVHDYSYPIVSIIVTCGPTHKALLIDALDSIQAQTFPDWECVVVNDTGIRWEKYIPGAPWAKVVNMDGNQGTAAARNEGLKYIRGKCVVWMDADDYWLPWFLERMVASVEKNKGIIFSDIIMDDGKSKKIYTYKDVDYSQVPFHMSYAGSSILIPRDVTESMVLFQGGFDTNIPGMEDWDYQIAVHSIGACAYYLPEPLFVYRLTTSSKRENDFSRIEEIKSYLDVKWKKYRKDGNILMCDCNHPKRANNKPDSMLSSSGNFTTKYTVPETTGSTEMVTVEYLGPILEPFSIRSRIDRLVNYRFANNPQHKERTVFLGDANFLAGMLDGVGKPLFRIKGISSAPESHDPTKIVGEIAH